MRIWLVKSNEVTVEAKWCLFEEKACRAGLPHTEIYSASCHRMKHPSDQCNARYQCRFLVSFALVLARRTITENSPWFSVLKPKKDSQKIWSLPFDDAFVFDYDSILTLYLHLTLISIWFCIWPSDTVFVFEHLTLVEFDHLILWLYLITWHCV